MDEQLSRERAAAEKRDQDAAASGSSQDQAEGQAGARPDPQGATQGVEGKPSANSAESGPPDQVTGAGTGARAGEYS
ncbi:MAG: hypothetical protein ACJ74W_09595 [Pyrinomonadaceae bacterium]